MVAPSVPAAPTYLVEKTGSVAAENRQLGKFGFVPPAPPLPPPSQPFNLENLVELSIC